jgi:transposase
MGRVNTPILAIERRRELEDGLKQGRSHCYRMRCQSKLLKSEGRTSKEVGMITDMSNVSVNTWMKQYSSEGVSGLQIKPGRGKKRIIVESEDKEAILSAIKANRQRMRTAKAAWEQQSGTSVFNSTFRACLNFIQQ